MAEEQQPLDHIDEEQAEINLGQARRKENDKKGDVIDNIKSYSTWKRFLFILIFMFIFTLSKPIVYIVMSINFLTFLFTGEKNPKLSSFGHSLGKYISQVIDYLSLHSDEKPYPFEMEWPN